MNSIGNSTAIAADANPVVPVIRVNRAAPQDGDPETQQNQANGALHHRSDRLAMAVPPEEHPDTA